MTTETCGYRMKIQHFSALQILSIKTRGYRHKCHPTLLSIELQLQLPTIVTNDLELHRSYFDNYLSKLAFSTYFTIDSKMATTRTRTRRTWYLFEHIELLLQPQTTVTIILKSYRSYLDNYLSKLAFRTYFMIHGKMVTTTTRTLHLFEHIELLSQLKII